MIINHHLPRMALAATLMGLASVGFDFSSGPDILEALPIDLDTADARRKIERNAALGMQYGGRRVGKSAAASEARAIRNLLNGGDYSDIERRAMAILDAEDHGTHADWQALRPKRKFKHNRRG